MSPFGHADSGSGSGSSRLSSYYPAYVAAHDDNHYTLGRIGKHSVVIAVLPGGEYGTASAAGVARDMLHTFTNIRIGLMVGIGGGAPSSKNDIRLGDVVVSEPKAGLGGVFQYDFGKNIQDQPFQSTRSLAPPPPPVLLTAISGLRAECEIDGHTIRENIKACLAAKKRLRKNYSHPDAATDRLFQSNVAHPVSEASCANCGSDASSMIVRPIRDGDADDPTIHYGLIASANQLMRDAKLRDQYANEKGILCFKMEAGGLMNHFPCLVIRGICDYSDTHKNKEWQGYAAMTAAAYTKGLLKRVLPNKVEAERRISELLESILSISIDTQTRVQGLQTSAHLDKIVQWLSAPDPSTNFNSARELHHPGTGQWLLESDMYRSWKTNRGSFLWLHGIPGCGKTILSSSVVADLANDPVASNHLLYFYFNFTDINKRSTENAVRSLIDQLYCNNLGVRRLVDSLYAPYATSGGQPTHASLQSTLRGMLQDCGAIWIILDGLDECETRSKHVADGIMPWIKNLRNASPNIHLLVTSRPEQDIKAGIDAWSSAEEAIPLQSDLVSDDIAAYIHTKVAVMKRWQTRPGIQKHIATVLKDRANGMFRWVTCQFDILEQRLSPGEVNAALTELPRTLDGTYSLILQRLHPEHKPHAIRLLQLLTYSERPLRIEEAVDALAIDPASRPRFDPANRMPIPEEIARYCSSLVSLTQKHDKDEINQTVEIQLAHFSVQEYFRSSRLQPDLAGQLGRTAAAASLVDLCVSYLLELDTSLSVDKIKEEYPFAEFSAQYWSDYAVLLEVPSQEIPKAVEEDYAFNDAFILGYTLFQPDYKPWEPNPTEATPLYYASFAGLTASVRRLLKKDAKTNMQCGYLGTALQAASYRGHDDIVQILVENGADVNAQGGVFGNALQAASDRGHEGVVQILIRKGADVNAQSGQCGNALQAASWTGRDGVVRALIQSGANVNAQGGHYGNALQAASWMGQDGIIQILIQHGADVNVRGGRFGNALQAASPGGHDGVVHTLIENGADVNANGGFWGSRYRK